MVKSKFVEINVQSKLVVFGS